MGNIIHFEQLWEKSEKVAASLNLTEQTEIIGKISAIVEEIKDIYRVAEKSNDKQLVQGMKSKAMGRLIMSIAALSGKENIDIYAALKDQLDILDIKDKFIF